jgi:phosphoenolpyruvate synthase/pyruvate phosphate dikinase
MAASPAGAEDGTAIHAGIIQWLDAAQGSGGPVELGGKAGPLARLLAAGLPVPPGFVIAPDVFPGTATADRDTADALDARAAEEVRRAYVELGRRAGEGEPYVAVRSSATAEDLEGASFAGQYETFLGVRGADAVVEHAWRCWQSLWTEHATAYRKAAEERLGRALPAPRMAVLVQALIPADAAGVAFTADPVTGESGAVTINAAWGLGQSVVDGEVEADTWKIERQSLTVVQLTTGRKATRSGIGPAAERVPVPETLQTRPCLTPDQAGRVAALALRAEEVIGGPADVEWALQEDTLWLLQARPITTGAAPGAAAETTTRGAGEQGPAKVQEEGPVGPTAAFPFQWPDPADAERCWKLRSIGRDHGEGDVRQTALREWIRVRR